MFESSARDITLSAMDQSIGTLPETTGEKLRRIITRLRAPIAILGVLLLTSVLDDMRAFLWGLPVTLLGELIQIWASSHVYRKERRLTTSGPYAIVRNPMYVGRFFVLMGFVIMTGIPALVGLYVLIYAYYAQIRVKREERFLLNTFGEPYAQYCAHVNRWWPHLKPYEQAESRPARWQQVRVNHEHFNLLMVTALNLIVFLRIAYLPPDVWGF